MWQTKWNLGFHLLIQEHQSDFEFKAAYIFKNLWMYIHLRRCVHHFLFTVGSWAQLAAVASCSAPTLTKAEDKSLWDKSTKVKEKLKFNLFTLLRTEAEATFWNSQKTFHTSTGKNNPGDVYLKKSGRREEIKTAFFLSRVASSKSLEDLAAMFTLKLGRRYRVFTRELCLGLLFQTWQACRRIRILH